MNGTQTTDRPSEWYRYVIGGLITVACAAAGLLVGGCASNRSSIAASSEDSVWTTAAPPLRAASDSPVGDVPVPSAFSLQQSKSWVRRWGAVRFVHHVYRGGDSTNEVADFYLRTMGNTASWRLASVNENGGEYALLFEKPNEYCFIKITKSWFFGLYKYVTIEISPKPQGSFTPPDQTASMKARPPASQ